MSVCTLILSIGIEQCTGKRANERGSAKMVEFLRTERKHSGRR